MSPILSEACHRTRQHISLRLDSELSELEEALVAAHLARCAACSTFTKDVERFTETLRTAPLAEPSTQFTLPRRPTRFSPARVGSAAAAAISIAVAVGGIALSGVLHLDSGRTRLSASDIELAQTRMILKERLATAIEGAAEQTHEVPLGLMAAEDATLGSTERG
jgi:predicted anti-sigma-YlaC factor YlaD